MIFFFWSLHKSDLVVFVFSAWLASDNWCLQVMHVAKRHYFTFFNGWVIFYCVYVPLYPFNMSMDTCSFCFHVLAIVNIASVNIGCFLKICEFLLPALLHLFVGFYYSDDIFPTSQQGAETACLLSGCSCHLLLMLGLFYKVKLMFLILIMTLQLCTHCCFWGKQYMYLVNILVITMSQYLNNPNSTFEIFKKFYDVIHFPVTLFQLLASRFLLAYFCWVTFSEFLQ